ncbi:MAG TPA: acetoin utilization protein AcuC [Mycobacteriales bacterium]|jgi:acetoin utilization protein AcuC|nr:acetoin utilization protein AcuC [Mycobacteriales bacterium]
MSDSVDVVWDDVFTTYDFGPNHPLRPLRLELTMALSRQLGLLDRPGVRVVAPSGAGDDLLALVHDRDYIAAVKAAPDDLLARLSARYGLGSSDNPVFERMHEAAALVTGASVDAVRAVWSGEAQHAMNISGGLHHAMRNRASGFCIYDDPAVAIAWLLSQGAQRVAYVDIDVHHGDGVQAAFYDDPRVLTVSLHETGDYLFPGTGYPGETGRGAGRGTSVNVALPPGTDDNAWLSAFTAVVPDVLRAFRPQLILTQLGCDTHALDPLAHLVMSVDGQRTAYRLLHELAHELCEGRWVAVGGGGYEIVQVVPRAWSHALAEMVGADLTGETPDDWRELVRRRSGESAPIALRDGRDVRWVEWQGEDPRDAVSRAIGATRRSVFPALGLTP